MTLYGDYTIPPYDDYWHINAHDNGKAVVLSLGSDLKVFLPHGDYGVEAAKALGMATADAILLCVKRAEVERGTHDIQG